MADQAMMSDQIPPEKEVSAFIAKSFEYIYQDFLHNRLKRQVGFEDITFDFTSIQLESTDGFEEMTDLEREMFIEIGDCLSICCVKAEKKNKCIFESMVSSFIRDDEELNCGFNRLRPLARRLIEDDINWGRIAALLCFSYHIIVAAIKNRRNDIPLVVKKTIKWITEVFSEEAITDWISEHGGWEAIITESHRNDSLRRGYWLNWIAVGVIGVLVSSSIVWHNM